MSLEVLNEETLEKIYGGNIISSFGKGVIAPVTGTFNTMDSLITGKSHASSSLPSDKDTVRAYSAGKIISTIAIVTSLSGITAKFSAMVIKKAKQLIF